MLSAKELTVDKIETYQRSGVSDLFVIRIDGSEIVAFNREESELLVDLLQRALKEKKELA
ncbi:hypothetical protein IN666_01480 [Bacteroides fragilis]|uniref:hypothetical protein n=1 Tax=Bacteroides fragilis TaxID=817 RepID=UPI00187ACD46|nr:hypothetical protein [Bacteroides fragilis]MBE7398161.1 hypothetical protein [Bacteroides fragilis]MBW9279292.1 hypothetical protein [Bacteroides fragilis]